jgi:hypothetical protein
MRCSTYVCFGLLTLSLLAGCGGSSGLKAKGRVVKNGQPLALSKGEGLRIIFAPQASPDERHYDSYAAAFSSDNGTFEVMGKDGKGMPAGKYRVSLELLQKKEDQFRGKLSGKNSPIVLDVTRENSRDLLIDLDAIKLDDLLKQPEQPKQPVVRKRRN